MAPAALPHAITSDTLLPLCLCAALGSLLPDLDAEFSLLSGVKIGAVRPFAPLAASIHRAWGHRGRLHSPGILAFVSLTALLLAAVMGVPVFGLAFGLGYASHLALDACTRTGIPKWPLPGRLWLLPPALRVVTGSAMEDALFLLLGATCLLLLLLHLPVAFS